MTVGTVVASDEDGEDSVVNYVVSGGVDGSLFSVTSGGVLTFNSAPDFESPSDSDSNNVYVADVTVISGTGSRVRNATQSITVTVSDVDEAPSAPSAPVDAVKLIGNLQQVNVSAFDVLHGASIASAFTTGSNSGGYVVSEVKVNLTPSTVNMVAGIYATTNNGKPGDKLYDFTSNSTGNWFFTAPANAVLNTNTTYFFVLATANASDSFSLHLIGSSGSVDQDSDSSPGWSLTGTHSKSSRGSSSWITFSHTGIRMGVFGTVRNNNRWLLVSQR